jgi:hypothetical protein
MKHGRGEKCIQHSSRAIYGERHTDGTLRELNRGEVVCLYVTHGLDERQAFVIGVTNVRVPEQVGNILAR